MGYTESSGNVHAYNMQYRLFARQNRCTMLKASPDGNMIMKLTAVDLAVGLALPRGSRVSVYATSGDVGSGPWLLPEMQSCPWASELSST